MTCVVGIKHDGKVYLGADGRTVDDYGIIHPSEPKVWVVGQYAMGYCGQARIGQLIQHAFTPPALPSRADPHAHLIVMFATELAKILGEFGIDVTKRAEGGNDYLHQFGLMIGLAGRLFLLDEDLCVTEYAEYEAMGSGQTWAQGSLRRTGKLGAKRRIQFALLDATAYCTSVGPPYAFVSV